MSILIKGMEMPTNCMDCPFKGFDRAKGRGNICTIDDSIALHAVLDGVDVKFVRMGDCPIVEIPPHGRLIDADALAKQMERNLFAIEDKAEQELGFDETIRRGMQYGHAVCVDAVNNAPTILASQILTCFNCKHDHHCLTQAFVEDESKYFNRRTFYCSDAEPTILEAEGDE